METFEEPLSKEKDQIKYDRYVGVKVRKNMDGKDLFGWKGFVCCCERSQKEIGSNCLATIMQIPFIYTIKWHDFEFEAYRANEVIEAMLMNVADEGKSLLHVQ